MGSLKINSIELKLLVGMILFGLLQAEVFTKCPDACRCVFNYTEIKKNEAVCQTRYSTVRFEWKFHKGHPALVVICKGIHYNCSDMPQFNVKDKFESITIIECAPSVLRCVQDFYKGPFIIPGVYLRKMNGNYTNEDIKSLDKIWPKALHFHEINGKSRSILPAGVFCGLNSLINLEIAGDLLQSTRVTSDIFTGLHSLMMLRLCMNNVDLIELDAFSNLTSLEILIIDYNILEFLPNKLFENLQNLIKIYITENSVNLTLDTHAFAHLPKSVTTVSLNKTKISTLPENVFSGSSNLINVISLMNPIEVLPSKIFWPTSSLQTLNFTSNQIKEFPDGIFSKLQELRMVDFSDNNIETLNDNLFAFNLKLQDVYLANNKIKRINMDSFMGANLQILSLASNKIERIIGHISSSWKLKKLILSNNNFNNLEELLLQLTELENLDLSNNKIIKIMDYHIIVWNFIQIDLRNNNISCIEQTFPELPESLATNKNVTVYLSKNSMECDCVSNLIIKDWYNRGWVPDFNEIFCANGEILSSVDLHLKCNKDHSSVLSISIEAKVFGGLIVSVILIVICVRICKCIKRLFNRRTKNSLTIEDQQDLTKTYDIFISFAHQDSEFVIDKLLPKFEYEYGYKVCVHYRDWIVGELIPDQIKESVENSCRTIIILSKHLSKHLSSEWAQLELRTACNLSALESKPKLIVILLDERILVDENLDKDFKSYIARNTYLLWDDFFFWKKLIKILPKLRKLT